MKAGWGRAVDVTRMVAHTALGDFIVEASGRGLRAVTPLRVGAPAPAEAWGTAAARHHAAAAAGSLERYAAGDRSPFVDALDVPDQAFHRAVRERLRAIPFGATVSYGEIAAALGMPGEARAIGAAVATNPACILVPCHRVVGADGSLRGFAWGLDLKRRLLAHEGSATPSLFAGAIA